MRRWRADAVKESICSSGPHDDVFSTSGSKLGVVYTMLAAVLAWLRQQDGRFRAV